MPSEFTLLTPCKRESRKQAIITGMVISIILNAVMVVYASRAIRQVNWLKPIENIVITELFDNLSSSETQHPTDVKRSSSNKINSTVFDPAPVDVGDKLSKKPIPIPKDIKPSIQPLAPMKKLKTLKPKRSDIASQKNQIHDQYRRMMDFKIKKSFPKLDDAATQDINKPVQIRIVIEPSSGKLKDIDIIRSSNSKAFDNAAVLAIKKASPFPPIDVDIKQLAFIIPFSYNTAN